MRTRSILPGQRLDEAQTERVLADFHRDGFALVPGVLTAGEVSVLRAVTDRCFADPALQGTKYIQGDFILRHTLELDPVFTDMLVREPILGLAEAVVGADCRFCGQNVIRNQNGLAIARWHVDDVVEFPLPEAVPRHDGRARMPVQWFTVQMALSDVLSEADGPTQFVPGSHYSGRHPNDPEAPTFEGRGPVSILCRAGDIYLQNNQCWHRGGPHGASRARYILQSQYAARWAFRRFCEYNHVPVADSALAGDDGRLRRVLGLPAAG